LLPRHGRITVGHTDPTSNQSDNPPLSFAVIDNLRIEAVPEPATSSLAFIASFAILRSRKR
jgi:hypothetical protein